jgi:hypothetical protein
LYVASDPFISFHLRKKARLFETVFFDWLYVNVMHHDIIHFQSRWQLPPFSAVREGEVIQVFGTDWSVALPYLQLVVLQQGAQLSLRGSYNITQPKVHNDVTVWMR